MPHSSSGLFPTRDKTGNFWRDHNLTIVLTILLVIQTLLSLWSAKKMWVAEEMQDKVSYFTYWFHEYNISLVADTFGVALIVVLTIWLREAKSNQG